VASDPLAPGPTRDRAVRQMFDRIARRYDRVNSLLTFGMDRGWRRRAVASLGLAPGSLVIDVACGTGGFLRELETASHRCVGFDISEGMLRAGGPGLYVALADGLRLPVADAAASTASRAVSPFATSSTRKRSSSRWAVCFAPGADSLYWRWQSRRGSRRERYTTRTSIGWCRRSGEPYPIGGPIGTCRLRVPCFPRPPGSKRWCSTRVSPTTAVAWWGSERPNCSSPHVRDGGTVRLLGPGPSAKMTVGLTNAARSSHAFSRARRKTCPSRSCRGPEMTIPVAGATP